MSSACADSGDDLEPTQRFAGRADADRADAPHLAHPPDSFGSDPINFLSGSEAFPVPGDRLLHFDLVEELGRGAFARVFLAKQQSLANRFVALKVTTTPTDEPQKLARLQHPNVVPVYSVHRCGNFQVLCMPFLGRVTLCRILLRMTSRWVAPPTSGRELIGTLLADTAVTAPLSGLHRTQPPLPENPLARMGYVEAVLWIAAELAAGLAHAHDRGLLHRDLKPANILITTDGTPLLLDFNVSSDSVQDSGNSNRGARVGGTLPYMSPEHLRAFAGEDCVVDERSDLYSLGVILYELLAGRLPYALPTEHGIAVVVAAMLHRQQCPPVSPRHFNPHVSPATAAIVLKLLAPNPADRYFRADNLHDDLQRQRANRPLAFAPNPSPRERLGKWRRRNPRLATGVAVAAAALLLVLAPAGIIAAWAKQSQQRAEARLLEVEQQRAADEGALRDAERSRALLDYHTANADLAAANVLLASRIEPEYREQGFALARAVLDRYGVLRSAQWSMRPGYARLDSAEQARLNAALAETLILMTRAELQRPDATATSLAEARQWNAAAAQLLPAAERPDVLARHRAELDGQPHSAAVPKSALELDLYFDGLDLAAASRFREALPLLVQYTEHRPADFRGWFARGLCHHGLGQGSQAAAAFAVCAALRPELAAVHFTRGLVQLKARSFAEAERAFTSALQRKPGWGRALLHRGLAREGLRRFAEAETDYAAALRSPDRPTRLYFLRGGTRAIRGDSFGAAGDWFAGMTREPADARSYGARGKRWMDAKQWLRALDDFEAALRLQPTMWEALLDKAIVLGDGLNRETEAVPVLDRLLEFYPEHIEARAGRGVYFARLGRGPEARRDARDTLAADRSAFRHYQMAGLFAQLSKTDPTAKPEAIRLFGRALRLGFNDWAMLKGDPDIVPIRDDPAFRKLLAAAQELDGSGK